MEKDTRLAFEMNVLILNPYHTGSHAHWAEGLQQHLSQIDGITAELWTLPGRNWKWRMHGAGGEFAHRTAASKAMPDIIITTDMLDVASFKGLLTAPWRPIPVVQYFHENQLSFPWSPGDTEKARGLNHTYEFINIQSCTAADWIWFNSSYHKKIFIEEATSFMKRMPDYKDGYSIQAITKKSSVLPVGINTPEFTNLKRPLSTPPTILWNHRWAYDKGPEKFFESLDILGHGGHEFQLIMCGRKYEVVPTVFQTILDQFSNRILHYGYATTREKYIQLLHASDFIIHDPLQEYFGVSVAEAMSFGVIPLLNADQAYPSWFPEGFLYRDSGEMLSKWDHWKSRFSEGRELANATASDFFWPNIAQSAYRELCQHFEITP